MQRAVALARDLKDPWSDPELLRLSASVSFAEGDATSAERKLTEATEMALQSGASFFALLAASDLAEAYLQRGRAAAARDLLQPVLSGFTEGSTIRDVARASSLLQLADARLS